jgi:hypothetical protein
MIEDAIILIMVFVAGAFVGWRVNNHLHLSVLTDILERAGVTPERLEQINADLEKEVNADDDGSIEIRIEQHSDVLYAYRKDTEEFIGQGTDREALLARLVDKFPTGARLIVDEANGAKLIKENPTS